MLVDVNEAQGSALAHALGVEGYDAAFVRADVSSKPEVDAAIAVTVARFERIDILVNNAGITHAAEFLDLEEKDFDRVMAVNLKSMFLMSQAVARLMVKQPWPDKRGGAIVNMSSVNAVLAIPNQVPYVISKGGVNQLTKVSAIALAPYHIRVNAIGPGTILTEMAKAAVLTNDESRRKIVNSGWTNEFERPIYFLEHREGFAFGEGMDYVRLFWKSEGKFLSRQLTREENVTFCRLAGIGLTSF